MREFETGVGAPGYHEVLRLIEDSPVPVVAALFGTVMGGGLETAIACHYRVAREGTRLGLPEITLGIIPGAGGTQRLPRLIGPNRAKEFIFSGDFFKAEACREMGLVNRVVPVADLMEEAKKLARRCIRNGAVALACAKACVNDGLNTDLYSGLSLERKCFSLLFSTEDQKEGMAAFKEKRKADFKGR
jgi:enoyl-CoA hydratase